MAQVPHLLVGRLELAEEFDHLHLGTLDRIVVHVVGALVPQVSPELLDGVEVGHRVSSRRS